MLGIHAELTASGEEIILLAAGPAEHVAMAAKQLQLLTPHFRKSDPPGALVVPASWPAVVQLAAAFGDSWCPGPRLHEWIVAETARRTEPLAQTLSYTPPAGLVPRDYQVAGALEIARTGRALIFDEPRTGKTITTILGLVEWQSRHAEPIAPQRVRRPGPILVVCPASVVDPWVDAWRSWAPHQLAVAWRGSKRRALAGTADVYVTSYDTARIDASEMSKDLVQLEAQALVVDESHYIKNSQTHRSRAVRRLAKRVKAFVALSGTPITHHPADLWPTLACLAPEANPAKERWVNRYCQVVPGEYDDQILGLLPATEPEFRLSILGQHRRVARADVMAQLPAKTYSVRTVDMPAKWRKVYDDLECQMLAELPDGQELSVMDTLSVLTHLSTLACAAADVEITYGPDVDENTDEPKRHVHLDLKAPSWKVDALLEILAERPGEQVVCFAPSAQLVRLAGAAASEAGYRVGYVVGGQAAGERTAAIRAFQAGELDLICATTGAGGEGITLSAAGTLVFLQRPWSLVKSLQAEDRAEGDMSATRGTEIVDVITRSTIDTRVRSVLRERAGQLSDLVQDPRIVAQLLGGASVTQLEAVS